MSISMLFYFEKYVNFQHIRVIHFYLLFTLSISLVADNIEPNTNSETENVTFRNA